jgi:hypothetical protein
MLSLPRSSCGLDSLHLTVSGSESYAPLPLLIQVTAFKKLTTVSTDTPPPLTLPSPSPPPSPPLSVFSRLVTCSTCSNHLVLPSYSSREQLIAKLRLSVAEKTFGLA